MIIFIAIPTKGTVAIPTRGISIEHGVLTEEFLKFLARLHVKYPEHTFLCPMVQDYQLLKYMEVEPIWEKWGQHCRDLIEVSNEVWVLKFNGWETSVGVAGEIAHANLFNKPVSYLEIDHV